MSDLAAQYQDAERAYTCAVMHVATAEVVAAVASDDLADPLARRIHAAATVALADGRIPDVVAITAGMGPDARTSVVDVYTHPGAVPAHWRSYAEIVLEGAYRRRAVAVAERIIQAAEESSLDVLAGALGMAKVFL